MVSYPWTLFWDLGSWVGAAVAPAAEGRTCMVNSPEGRNSLFKVQTTFLLPGRRALCGLAQNTLQQCFLHVKLMVSLLI